METSSPWSIYSRQSAWHHLINYYYELNTIEKLLLLLLKWCSLKNLKVQKNKMKQENIPSLIMPNTKILIPLWWSPKMSAISSFSPCMHMLFCLSRGGVYLPLESGLMSCIALTTRNLKRYCCAQTSRGLANFTFPLETSCRVKSLTM